MADNIYSMLNDMEVALPTDVELNDLEKQRIKNRLHRTLRPKKNHRNTAAIAAAAVLCVGLFSFTPVSAIAAQKLMTAAVTLGDFLGITGDLAPYTTVIGKSVSDKGITIQLEEVVLNGDSLVVHTILRSEQELADAGASMNGTVYINGRAASFGAGGGSKQIDKNTSEEVLSYGLETDLFEDDGLSGTLNVRLVYDACLVNGEEVRGDWSFAFQTSGDELAGSTKTIPLNQTFTLGGKEGILERLTQNAVGTQAFLTYQNDAASYVFQLVGQDDKGRQVSISMRTGNGGKIKLEDDGAIGMGVAADAKALTLQLQAAEMPKESGRMSNEYQDIGEPFTVDLEG